MRCWKIESNMIASFVQSGNINGIIQYLGFEHANDIISFAAMACLLLTPMLPVFLSNAIFPKLAGNRKKTVIVLMIFILTTFIWPLVFGWYAISALHPQASEFITYYLHNIEVNFIVNVLFYSGFVIPHIFRNVLHGSKRDYVFNPPDNSQLASVYSKPLTLTLLCGMQRLYMLFAVLMFAAGILHTTLHLSDALSMTMVKLTVYGFFITIIVLQPFIVPFLLRCDACHRHLLANYRKGDYSKQCYLIMNRVLLKREFTCQHCGAYYALSERTLKKHQQKQS